jgi:hypothetical protein
VDHGPGQSRQKCETLFKKATKAKKGWVYGPSGRTPTEKGQGSEFKAITTKKSKSAYSRYFSTCSNIQDVFILLLSRALLIFYMV